MYCFSWSLIIAVELAICAVLSCLEESQNKGSVLDFAGNDQILYFLSFSLASEEFYYVNMTPLCPSWHTLNMVEEEAFCQIE